MGVGAGLYMYVVVVQKFTFAISSPDEFLFIFRWIKIIKMSRFYGSLYILYSCIVATIMVNKDEYYVV